MEYRLRVVIVILITILSGCRSHTILKTNESPPIELKSKIKYVYKIQPYDRVKIALYKYPDLVATDLTSTYINAQGAHSEDMMQGVMLDSEGKITLPLVGRVKLGGLTQTQASEKLEKLYAKYVKDPSITVQVLNKKVFVLGEVKSSKSIILDRDIVSLYEILAKCGGFTNDAQRDNITIISHDDNGDSTIRRVDFLSFNRVIMSNIIIKPGDVIYVPPSAWKEYRLTTDNYLSVLRTISQILGPYLMMKNVFDWD